MLSMAQLLLLLILLNNHTLPLRLDEFIETHGGSRIMDRIVLKLLKLMKLREVAQMMLNQLLQR